MTNQRQRPSVANCNIGQKSYFTQRYHDVPPSPTCPHGDRASSNVGPDSTKPRIKSYRPQPRKPVEASYRAYAKSPVSPVSTDSDLPISTAFRDVDARIVDDIMRLLRQPGSTFDGGYGFSYGYDKFMPQPLSRMPTAMHIRPSHAEPPAPAAIEAKSMVAELVEDNPDPLFAPLNNKPSDAFLRETWKPADTVLAAHSGSSPKYDANKERVSLRHDDGDKLLVPSVPTVTTLRRKDAQRLPAVPRRHKLLRNAIGQECEPNP